MTYAEYLWHSRVTAPRISGGIWRNMAGTQLGASGLQNSLHTRESHCTLLVKLAQKGQQNSQMSHKCQQNEKSWGNGEQT